MFDKYEYRAFCIKHDDWSNSSKRAWIEAEKNVVSKIESYCKGKIESENESIVDIIDKNSYMAGVIDSSIESHQNIINFIRDPLESGNV